MSGGFLLDRFQRQGTLSAPKGVPDPQYSLPASVNWMRALAIFLQHSKVNSVSMRKSCALVHMKAHSDQTINSIFEQLLMSMHHLAALMALDSHTNKTACARSGIVTWYYGIYHAASAMVTAQDGNHSDTHASTANSWDRCFFKTTFVPECFRYRLSTLVRKDTECEIAILRGGIPSAYDLNRTPVSFEQAKGACLTYLKGTADWKSEEIQNEMKHKDLKKEGFPDYRTKRAQALRDARLKGRAVGFVHQAFRYRGKANYREALFITYGAHVETTLSRFYQDMAVVLRAFLCLAGVFCSRRLDSALWRSFLDDLQLNVNLGIDASALWMNMEDDPERTEAQGSSAQPVS
jgi:hypothetical protein